MKVSLSVGWVISQEVTPDDFIIVTNIVYYKVFT